MSNQEERNKKLDRKAYDVLFDIGLIILFIIIIIATLLDIKIAVYICAAIGILIICIRGVYDLRKYLSKRNIDKKATNAANSNQDDN